MRKPVALITGITGQDGSYLAELLLEKGYTVHGLVRRVAIEDPEHRLWRISHLLEDIEIHSGSLESFASVHRVVRSVHPDECYHLAAQSYVSYSFEDEFSTLNVNVNGTHYILAAIHDLAPGCRFYFAGTSEMFGRVDEVPQNERSRFHPRSAYGISKVAGFDLTRNYREAYGIPACSGILYNHESPRRGFEFVSRKITFNAARIKLGLANAFALGNLDAQRDWGHARDYVKAMWLMLQQPVPEDYVIASGQTHSVREFVELAFAHLGMDYRNYLQIDPELLRPSEADLLQGDARRARETMGWTSTISFQELVCEMVESDLRRLSPAPPRQDVASEESRPGRLVVIRSRHRADSGPDTVPFPNHRTVGFTTGRNRE